MSIMRVHKTKNFTVMSNYHFKEKSMSLKAKGLLSLMLSLPDDWNYSISGLVKLSKDGKDSVMSALAELEKFGYLKRDRLTDSKGRFAGVEYHIYEEPQADIPVADNPNYEEQNEDKRNAEEPPQLNTKELTTKESTIKEIKESKKEVRESYDSILSQNVVNEGLRELYIDYIRMRQMNNRPLTNRALSMLIQRCERLSNFSVGIQKRMLENAILNNWNNVYLPNEEAENEQSLRQLRNFYEE